MRISQLTSLVGITFTAIVLRISLGMATLDGSDPVKSRNIATIGGSRRHISAMAGEYELQGNGWETRIAEPHTATQVHVHHIVDMHVDEVEGPGVAKDSVML